MYIVYNKRDVLGKYQYRTSHIPHANEIYPHPQIIVGWYLLINGSTNLQKVVDLT